MEGESDPRGLLEILVDWYAEFHRPWRYRDESVWRELASHHLVEVDRHARTVRPTARGLRMINRARDNGSHGSNGNGNAA